MTSPAHPEGAQAFLNTLPNSTRRLGEKLVADRKVARVVEVKPGTHYRADVESFDPARVEVRCDRLGVWRSDCTCVVGNNCKHAYALLRQVVKQAGQPGSAATASPAASSTADPAASPTPEAAEPAPPARPGGRRKRGAAAEPVAPSPAAALLPPLGGRLEERLRTLRGAPLTTSERNWIGRIVSLWKRARPSGALTGFDLADAGFSPRGPGWDRIQLFQDPPESEHEFWLYLAHHLKAAGRPIPEFLLPVTNLEALAPALARWQRREEVARWQTLLDPSSEWSQAAAAAEETAPADFRVRFLENALVLESRDSADQPFKATRSQNFASQAASVVTPVNLLLVSTFTHHMTFGGGSRVTYRESEAATIIRRLFGQPSLEGALVDGEGEPLVFHPEPLRWEFTAATQPEGDHQLRLCQADGSTPPETFLVVEGQPNWYLTRTGVFTGPACGRGRLQADETNRIPAQALETAGGALFLRSLGVPLPPVLADRVRTIPYEVRVEAEVAEAGPGSDQQVCRLRVTGRSTDHHRCEMLTASGWMPVDARGTWTQQPKAEPDPGGSITFYERTALTDCRNVLDALNPRWDYFRQEWYFRVTRRFPEVFTEWLRTLPAHVATLLRGELADFQGAAVAGQITLEIAEADIDWFDLRVVVNVSDTELSQEEVKLLLDARGKWVRLSGKGWRRLEFQLSGEEDEQLARLGLTPHEVDSQPQRFHALQLADPAARRFLPPEKFEQVQRRAGEIQARVTPPIPPGIQAELRPYQLEGYHFLAYLAENRFGGILADDMGLGKTLQTLAWLVWLRARAEPPGPSLVVCPKSVTDNWRAESARFAPGLRVRVWQSTDIRSLPALVADSDLHVINYAQLRTLGEELRRTDFLAVILDEGQYIKNPSSVTTVLARQLRAAHRLILSGTPIENRLLDLWSLMSFAMPGVLGSRTEFLRLYDRKDDAHARRRLAARVRPFLLRRTKNQVARDLPDRVEEDLYCEIEGEQQKLYRAELKRAQQMLLKVSTGSEFNEQRFHVLTSLLRLRQICCDPRLLDEKSQAPSAKVEALLETIEPLCSEGQKVLVFSQFVGMLELLRAALEAQQVPHYYLVGDTENRGDLVRRFQSHPGAAVFLISLKAGGAGLNLTAASYVILFDPWWNPAVEAQAIDRTHRIGQQQKVFAYRLLIKDSIEEKIRKLQLQKGQLVQDVLGEENFAAGLTLDDFRFLLAD